MVIKSVKSVRDEVLKAYEAARTAENAWQAELDRLRIDRYSKAARGAVGSEMRALYDAKVAADATLAELTDALRRYQDLRQVIN